MKKVFISLIAISFFLPVFVWGQEDYLDRLRYREEAYKDIIRYKYNPMEDWWKFTPNKSQLKYNPMTNEWSYVYPGEVLRFNPAEDTWEYALPEKEIRYDLYENKWFFYHLPPKKTEEEVKEKLTPTSPIDYGSQKR